jgi:capping protein beta
LLKTVIFLLKTVVESKKEVEKGIWDSINFVNVQFVSEGNRLKAVYKLTTTIILQMSFKHPVCGLVDLSGSITRQNEETFEIKSGNHNDHQFHIEKIGKMVEELESTLRNQIEEIYFKKSQEVILV